MSKTSWEPVNRQMFLRGFRAWRYNHAGLTLDELKRMPSEWHYGYDMAERCPYVDNKRKCEWLSRCTPVLGTVEQEDLWNA